MKTQITIFLAGFLIAAVCHAASVTTGAPEEDTSTKVVGETATANDTEETASKSPELSREQIKEKFTGLMETCKKTSKIAKESASQIAINFGVPKTEEEKCYLNCIYDGLGLTKEGKFHEEGAQRLAKVRFASSTEDYVRARKMIDACSEEAVVKDTNEKCAIGRVLRECIIKNGSKVNFFPKP